MDVTALQKFAPPAGAVYVSGIAISAQWLFYYIEPGPLRQRDAYVFNVLVACLLICHWRTCYVDPGRIPKDWHERLSAADGHNPPSQRQRWCRRCEAFKPPRAHHCKTCKRCIVKMDHHCVWTANCVSYTTLPHFLRFLIYSVVSMIYLESFFYERCAVIWRKRHLPSYLGPSMLQLAHLLIIVVLTSFTLFMLSLLLGRTLWSAALNMTTIESWEIERHEALLRRSRVLGGYLVGPDGKKVHLQRQEFPWDVGIWTNLCQAFGSRNPLMWLWPFAKSPSAESGLSFEHNEIDDPNKPWPPPDPDRMYRSPRRRPSGNGFTQSMDVADFRLRQLADMTRYTDVDNEYVVRRRPFHERLEELSRMAPNQAVSRDEDPFDHEESEDFDPAEESVHRHDPAGEEAWRNKEGERLDDFGVDEVADFYDEDEMPLAELREVLRARQNVTR